ncbi:VWA domain-containing protein, partial [Streptomyces rameus]
RVQRPRRVVLLVDVSGSMAPYADALLRFAHAAVRAGRTEVFTIGTRLTRATRELSHRDPDLAMAALAAAVPDWRGGTRLGELLREFLNRWGQRGMARGAVVVLLSDGWERGDPELLGAQMRRLHGLAHQVIWANPRKARPGYAPLAAGMAAALPSVDAFVEGHSLAALERLAAVVRGASAGEAVGRGAEGA